MKKCFAIFLSLCLLLSLTGCRQESVTPEKAATVYYKRAELTYGAQDSVIVCGYLDTAGHENDYAHLINQYLSASPTDKFSRTFPHGTGLVSFALEALTAKIVLTDSFATLSGMDLTIACICLTQTVTSMTGCQEVIIRTETEQLDGQNFVIFSNDSYLLIDNGDENRPN